METGTCRFPNWVSAKIVNFYGEQGIKNLFSWQTEALEAGQRQKEKNLVFSAPTSAGKSIVAELLAWQVALSGKKVLFVFPYVSVAREKLHDIQKCWRRDDLPVCGFIGPQASNPNEWLGAVCTIEKAASLVNRALSEDWFNEIGMIVVDEIHMIFDSSRGAHIEHMLSKVMYWNKTASEKVRIIGMSATIPDIFKISGWLNDAITHEANYRPISLKNRIVVGMEMRWMNEGIEVIHEFDKDPLICLAEESFRQNLQTLVMVSSKMDAEKIAVSIAMKLHELNKRDSSIMNQLLKRADGLLFVKSGLERNGSKDRSLLKSLAWGIAFHHAGLTLEERECVELGFREKNIVILVATSTLASGVNLPAERVIIKAQTRGPSALTSLSYRQMVGRAGRTGHATRGESYLIVKKCDYDAVQKIINNPIEICVQKRSGESGRTDLCRYILEGICTGLATTRDQIQELTSLLLFTNGNREKCETSIDMLLKNSFVSIDGGTLISTQLGRASIASSLPPEASLFIFEDLSVASRAIALDTELHMLYLVTPINVSVWQECDWNHLFALFTKLPPDHLRVAKLVGASEKFILEQLQGRQNDTLLQTHIRFFSSLALFDLINEMSIYEVSNKYRIPRGCLQTLQSQSATYAAMIVAFCLRLGWTYLKSLLDGFAMRLLFGIRSELSELVTIDGIDGHRARILHEKGITCVSHLSSCETSKLAHLLTLAVPYSSSNSNDGLGQWLFGEPRLKVDLAAKILKDRARTVLEKRIKELGISLELTKIERKEETDQMHVSCDSGLPDSCADTETNEDQTLKNVEDIANSVLEMSLFDDKDSSFITEDFIEKDSAIDCLESSLLNLKSPKNETFSTKLSDTFSPAGRRLSLLNSSTYEDSFDNPVQGSVLLVFKTPKKLVTAFHSPTASSPYFEDSFDQPIPGSIVTSTQTVGPSMTPLTLVKNDGVSRSTRKHIHRNQSVSSPFSTYVSSPVLKHTRIDQNEFKVIDVCQYLSTWNHWVKSSSSSSSCSLSLANDYSGIGVSTDYGTTFISLLENGEEGISKCKVPLHFRLDFLKLLAQSSETYVLSMKQAFSLYEKIGIKVSHVNVLRVVAHLNHLIDCEEENNEALFPLLADRFTHLTPSLQDTYSSASIQKTSELEAFFMKAFFESLRLSAIKITSEESFELEMASCQCVLNMFYNGMNFDHASCFSFIDHYRKQQEDLETEIMKLAYGKFNLDSPHDVANVLFNRLGLIYPETASSKVRQRHLPTNKVVLEQMKGQHPVVEKILEYRHINHTISQCLLPLSEYDSRIHCWFEMCTATGRILSVKPNLQNVPKRINKDGNSVRKLFRPSPGNVLIGADYKQLELRVLAHFSNDSSLVELISQDRDLFEELSADWKFPRDAVKQMVYGLIYGMGAKTLSELIKFSIEEAENMLKNFFSMFPGVRSYINETKEKITEGKQVGTILGRNKIFPSTKLGEEKARIERMAVNYTIQGSASEIFKTAVVKIDSSIKKYDANIVMMIHDEVLVECPEHEVPIVSEVIRDCMESALSHILRVPLRVSLKTGQSWAELK